MHKISWTNKAKKNFRKIPQNQKLQIYQAISTLSQPVDEWHNVKKMKNYPFDYRLRVGNYRVIFDLHKQANIISIEKIGARNERTY